MSNTLELKIPNTTHVNPTDGKEYTRTQIPHFVYTSQDNDNSVFDTLDEKELLQLAHIVRKLYDNDIKLKIDYRVFK